MHASASQEEAAAYAPGMVQRTIPADRWDQGRWNKVYMLLYAVYIILGAAVRLNGWWNGDALWFVWASNHVLDGSWDLYGLRLATEVAPPDGITYSYSPLLAILTSPAVALAYSFGWGDDGAYRMMALPLLPFDVLAMHQLRLLVRAHRPRIDERILFSGIALILFISSFLYATAYKGHVEGLLLLLLILVVRYLPRRLLAASLLAGIMLATKHTTALLVLAPIGLIIAAGYRTRGNGEVDASLLPPARSAWTRGLVELGILGSIAVAIFALFMLPPVLHNGQAVYYTFVTLPQHLIAFGPGLPKWVNLLLENMLEPSQYESVRTIVLGYSNMFTLLVCAAVPAVVLWWARRKGNPIGMRDPRVWGLVALTLTASILSSKWVSDHYYQLPLATIFIWDMVRPARKQQSGDGMAGRAFPWLGIGSVLAYSMLTQIDPRDSPSFTYVMLPYLTDALMFGLFLAIAVLLVRGLAEDTLAEKDHGELVAAAPDGVSSSMGGAYVKQDEVSAGLGVT